MTADSLVFRVYTYSHGGAYTLLPHQVIMMQTLLTDLLVKVVLPLVLQGC